MTSPTRQLVKSRHYTSYRFASGLFPPEQSHPPNCTDHYRAGSASLLAVPGQIDLGHVLRNLSRIRLGQVGQHHDRQLVIDITRNLGLEALPCALVIDEAMSVRAGYLPAESVMTGIRFTVFQPGDSPHLLQAGALQKLFRV